MVKAKTLKSQDDCEGRYELKATAMRGFLIVSLKNLRKDETAVTTLVSNQFKKENNNFDILLNSIKPILCIVSRTEDQKVVISSYMQEIEARHPLEKCTYNGRPGYMYVIYSTSEEVKDYKDWMEKVFYIGISLDNLLNLKLYKRN